MLHRLRLALQAEGRWQARRRSRSGRNLHRRQGAQHAAKPSALAWASLRVGRWLERLPSWACWTVTGKDGRSQIRLQVVEGRKRGHFRPVDRQACARWRGHQHRFPSLVSGAERHLHAQRHRPRRSVRRWAPSTPTVAKTSGRLLKRAIKGTYVSVEPFHLFRYLDEAIVSFQRALRQRCVSASCSH